MYCVEVAKCRRKLFPDVAGHHIFNGTHHSIRNYYTPEKNCLDSVGGKGLCNICGEKSKWKKNGVARKHSTKCCPYKYHFQIEDRKQFVDATAEFIKLNLIDELKASYLVNNECNHTIKNLEDAMGELGNKITEKKGEVNFLKSLISPEEIKMREENLNMYKEEVSNLNAQKIQKADEINKLEEDHKKQIEEKELALKQKEVIIQIEEKRHNKVRKDRDRLVKEHIRDNEIMATLRHQIAEDKNAMGQLEDENVKLLNIVKSNKSYVPPFYGENCCVCLCDIGMDNGITTPCKHHFHFRCYSDLQGNFMKQHSYGTMKCPLCRKGLFELNY